jgi:hypothetical protein
VGLLQCIGAFLEHSGERVGPNREVPCI